MPVINEPVKRGMLKQVLSEKPKGHQPVLLKEVLSLAPFDPPGEGKQMLDATFGCGGHSQAFLQHFPKLFVTALDWDLQAIKWGQVHLPKTGQLKLYHKSFHLFSDSIKKPSFDIILLDLGVSSLQLDQTERGFSFYKDGPLDMRMDQSQPLTAQDIINQASEQELKSIFFNYGRITFIHKVVQAILRERKKSPIKSTAQLANLIVKQTGWRKKGKHPATAYFLSLRLKVNQELIALKHSLPCMIKSLKPKGCLLVLSFHSAEDKIVKLAFKKAKEDKEGQVFKKSIFPSYAEVQKNPRARSAKLRVFKKA